MKRILSKFNAAAFTAAILSTISIPLLAAEESMHQHQAMAEDSSHASHSQHQTITEDTSHASHNQQNTSEDSSHASHNLHNMGQQDSHAGHQGMDSTMPPSTDDPHAQHRSMMAQSQQVLRSNHNYQVPDLTMKNKLGQEVSIRQLLNQDNPVMVNFIFTTCPTICPVLSSTFSVVNRELKAETKLTMISISIDPEQDTPAMLRDYANKFEARDNWHFITGHIENSIELQKAFNIYRGSKMNHIPATFFRASADQTWTRLDGFPSSGELITEYHKMAH